MGTISTGTGLISGIDIDSLVSQLIAIDSKPLTLVKNQITKVQKEQTAYSALSAQLLSAVSALKRLAKPSAFTVRSAVSSNESVLTASAKESTPLGTYSFQVRSLASTHQLVSSGFVDRNSTALTTGTLTFKSSAARVDTSTSLSVLNGTQGVRRGVVRITDREGGTAKIDLTTAVTLDDVLEAINSQSTANVKASVQGDHLVITDLTGAASGTLTVKDLSGGYAAADLGIAGSSTTDQLIGAGLVRVTEATNLSALNDGMGVRTNGSEDDMRFTLSDGRQININLSGTLVPSTSLKLLNDGNGINLPGTIRITNRYGASAEISLDHCSTVGDVMAAINTGGSGLGVSASLVGSRLFVADGSNGQAANFKIEDVTGTAASDLGILTDTSGTSVTSGVLYSVNTVGAVIRAIENANGNDGALTASLSASGKGIVLTDHTGQGGITVEALNGSKAARDLGLLNGSTGSTLQGQDLLAGLNTVLLSSLNGGQGVDAGVVEFTRRDGSTALVDFAGVQTLSDVIDRINEVGLTASIAAGGLGISITDSSAGAGTFSARDLSGATVADLHLTSTAAGRVGSGDLKRQCVSENTLLSELHQGQGIANGSFTVTAANGATGKVTLASSTHKTVGDVIKSINDLGIGVEARINADGDGIELVDTTGGSGLMMVAEANSGTTAADLGIVGQAKAGSTTITGTFSAQVTIASGDTLDTLVQKINAANGGVVASVLNDGTSYSPYRLVISSTRSGTLGKIGYDTGTTGLSLGDMSAARDAVVALTDGSSPNPVVVTSSSNSVGGVVDGLTLNLTSASASPVTVSIAKDTKQILADAKTFVDAFNSVMDQIDKYTSYDAETEEKGVLLGDHTVQVIHDKLFNEVTRVISGGSSTLKSLSQVGITVGSGARLSLDENKFTSAFEKDPEGVRDLFTLTTTDSNGKTVNKGFGVRLSALLSDITSSADGLINKHNQSLQDRVDMYNKRAEYLQEMLDKKEARLYKQFQAMESALASLQNQQSSLTSLSNLVSSLSSS